MELRQPAHGLVPLGRGDVCILQGNNKGHVSASLLGCFAFIPAEQTSETFSHRCSSSWLQDPSLQILSQSHLNKGWQALDFLCRIDIQTHNVRYKHQVKQKQGKTRRASFLGTQHLHHFREVLSLVSTARPQRCWKTSSQPHLTKEIDFLTVALTKKR